MSAAHDNWDDLDDKSLVPTGKTARELDKPAPDQFAKTDARSELSLGSGRSTIENRNQVAMFKCDACHGSGRFIRGFHNPRDYGPCNKCKGTGKLKTSPGDRKKRKDAAVKRKLDSMNAYIEQHVPEYTWAVANMPRFDFARSMLEAVRKHGSWTEGQLAAIRRCMAKDQERAEARARVEQAAPTMTGTGFEKMLAAFAAAKASGLKWPKLRISEFTFALAGERSKYVGQALFVKHAQDDYCGRLELTGRWFPTDAGKRHATRIAEICNDPMAAAVMHGKQTGHCACCGLELTNEESVRLGIGPICREKWGL